MKLLIMFCCLLLSEAEIKLGLKTDHSVDVRKVIISFFNGHQSELRTTAMGTGLIIIKENYISTSKG